MSNADSNEMTTIKDLLAQCNCNSGVAVLTDGQNLRIDSTVGKDFTGWWTASPERIKSIQCVAICHRVDPPSHRTRIHVGRITNVLVDAANRVGIEFDVCNTVEVDDFNWHSLAGGSNPVCYL